MTKNRKITLVILIAFSTVLATTCFVKRDDVKFLVGVFLFGIPCVSDVDEANKLFMFVEQKYFRKSSESIPDEPTIYGSPGGTGFLGQSPHTVIIYNVTDKKEQDKIIALISDYRAQNKLRNIKVEFYREENWRTLIGKDGRQSFLRHKEELVRSTRL